MCFRIRNEVSFSVSYHLLSSIPTHLYAHWVYHNIVFSPGYETPPPCVSEKILVTRDAVLLQPSGDPVSSGLLLPWLHHSYRSVIFFCKLRNHWTLHHEAGFSSPPMGDAYCICTSVCTHVSLTPSPGISSATVGPLAAVCKECADMHIHTSWLTNAYIFTCTLQSILNTARAAFDIQLENVFKAYWLDGTSCPH